MNGICRSVERARKGDDTTPGPPVEPDPWCNGGTETTIHATKPWRERWREQKRNKWARWVTARRKSRANGCLNARSARSALPRTSFPVVPTFATSEKFNNPTNGLAVAYYSYTHDPCGRVAANSILNGVTIEFRPWIIGDLPAEDPPEIFHPHSFLAFIFEYCSSLFFFFRKKRLIFSNIILLQRFWKCMDSDDLSLMDAYDSGCDVFIIWTRILKLNFTLFIHTRSLIIAGNKDIVVINDSFSFKMYVDN